MTSHHKQILLNNVENLQGMNLEKVVPQLQLAGLLDDVDKEDLLSDAKQASHRVEMLLTEILPRKGPSAFETFAQALKNIHPPMALKLLQDAGIKGAFFIINNHCDIIGVSLLHYCVYIDPLGLLPEVAKPRFLIFFNLCCIILMSHNLYQMFSFRIVLNDTCSFCCSCLQIIICVPFLLCLMQNHLKQMNSHSIFLQ